MLEIKQNNKEEMHVWIKGNILRFSIYEFTLITGLKCYGDVDDFRYEDSSPSRLMRSYFPQSTNGVDKEELEQLDLPPLSFASYHLGTSSTSSSTGDPNQMSYKDNMPQVAIDYDSFEDFSTTFPQYFKIDSINVFGSICAHKSKNEKSTVVGRTTVSKEQSHIQPAKEKQTADIYELLSCGVGKELPTQEAFAMADEVAQMDMSLTNTIKGLSTSAEKEYFSENDDPPRSRNRFTTKEKGRVLHIE
ncbi:hypothetical protein FXO37_28697 [Capsicum annuum]|nr:hypothetical protein FXO37_28697 [Capsicum annuum]